MTSRPYPKVTESICWVPLWLLAHHAFVFSTSLLKAIFRYGVSFNLIYLNKRGDILLLSILFNENHHFLLPHLTSHHYVIEGWLKKVEWWFLASALKNINLILATTILWPSNIKAFVLKKFFQYILHLKMSSLSYAENKKRFSHRLYIQV